MASIFFTARPPGHSQIQSCGFDVGHAQSARARPSDRLFCGPCPTVRQRASRTCGRPASTTNRSAFLKSRLYAKSLTGLIL